MDFSNRDSQQPAVAPRPGGGFPAGANVGKGRDLKGKHFGAGSKWMRAGAGVLLAGVVVLLVVLIGFFLTSGGKAEGSFVNNSKLQAVFLTNDQVYFGKITNLNGKYLVLQNIYYLQTAGNSSTTAQATNSNVSLVKLGCELHRPFDEMVINRSQVQFWENLNDDGQVATAVKTYKTQNPDGQKCSNTTTNSNNNVQGSTAPTTNESTTNSTNSSTSTSPTTKKP